MVIRSFAMSSPSSDGVENVKIREWFERRHLPYTQRMDTWLAHHEIDTPAKMKLVTIDQWRNVLLDESDPGTLVYRGGEALRSFEEHLEAYKKGDTITDSKVWCQYVLGALLAYFVLFLFVASTLWYIIEFYKNDCYDETLDTMEDEYIGNSISDILKNIGFYNQNRSVALSPEDAAILAKENQVTLKEIYKSKDDTDEYKCDYLRNDQITIAIHNVTFGLVSAVVVGTLVANTNEKDLYAKFRPLVEARNEAGRNRWYHNLLTHFVLQTTRAYVVAWILVGCLCLCSGIFFYTDESSLGMIFTTGQTWLGIAITQTYHFFGEESTQQTEEELAVNYPNPDEGGGGDEGIISTGNVNTDTGVKEQSLPVKKDDKHSSVGAAPPEEQSIKWFTADLQQTHKPIVTSNSDEGRSGDGSTSEGGGGLNSISLNNDGIENESHVEEGDQNSSIGAAPSSQQGDRVV